MWRSFFQKTVLTIQGNNLSPPPKNPHKNRLHLQLFLYHNSDMQSCRTDSVHMKIGYHMKGTKITVIGIRFLNCGRSHTIVVSEDQTAYFELRVLSMTESYSMIIL